MANPMLLAKFVIDSSGFPKAGYGGPPIHYYIRLMVKDAPDDTYAVTYELHETYYEPVRESRRSNEDFVEEITSYGDYLVRAIVRGKSQTQTLVAELSEALARGHLNEKSPAIDEALNDIRMN